jgi:lysophospholipase L1-like esterase
MQPMPRILLVGDSITQESFQPNGWGSALANWYIRRADVINRGLDGYNTRWVLQRRDQLAASLGPARGAEGFLLATLMLGANDNSSSYQHVPIDEYEANLRALAEWLLQDMGVQHLLVMAPPPYCATRHTNARGIPIDEAPRSDDRHAAYGDRAKAVAASVGAAFVSMRDAIRGELQEEWGTALHDGLHFSDAGNQIAFRAVQRAIEEQLPNIVPERLPYRFLPEFTAFENHSDGDLPPQ